MIKSLFIWIILLISSCWTSEAQIRFSVCDGEDGYGEHCINLGTIAHCDSTPRRSASVNGMWVFGKNEVFNTEGPAVAEFLYQDRIGVPYYTFKEKLLENDGGCWRRIGYVEDYKTNALSFHRVTSLLSDSTAIIKGNTGNSSVCMDKAFGTIKSFAILGNSSWTLTMKNGDSICIELKNTSSFIPGLVLDINDIGIQYGELCSAKLGCGDDNNGNAAAVKPKLVSIDNTITSGVLRRN